MRGSMNLIDADYPDWDMFDGSELSTVSSLGAKIGLVEWAADTGTAPPLCGVLLDGEYLVATDRYRLARVPCKIDGLPKPIIVPAGILSTVLRAMGDTNVGVVGKQLALEPDPYTQITTVIYDVDFPPVQSLFSYNYEAEVEVSKVDLLDKLNRACQYSGAERNPVIRTFWGKGGIAVMMENAEIGLIGDVVECPGQLAHDRIEILFTPKNLIDAVNHSPDAKIKLHYDVTETDPRISKHIRVDGGAGYQCIVMKRQHAQPTV
jgi:DNA polymerase III sliding clamp (beta) subunit (PCNA family)